jgi:hypothetical protein
MRLTKEYSEIKEGKQNVVSVKCYEICIKTPCITSLSLSVARTLLSSSLCTHGKTRRQHLFLSFHDLLTFC